MIKRPKGPQKLKTRSISMTPEEWHQVERLAGPMFISASALVRLCVKRALPRLQQEHEAERWRKT